MRSRATSVRTVATIGNFDGVHLGHQHDATAAQAANDRLPVVAVTFEPHPMAAAPEHAPERLTNLAQRAALLEQAGADHVLAIPFSREIATWTSRSSSSGCCSMPFTCRRWWSAPTFASAPRLLATYTPCVRSGFFEKVLKAIAIGLDGGPQVWSSTYIRSRLAAGDVEGAAEALGRPYSVTGVVSRGDQRGRELGFLRPPMC